MASRAQAATAFLLCLNLVFFSMVSAQTCSINYQLLNAANPGYCLLLQPLTNDVAAVCLCAAIKANLFGIYLYLDTKLTALLTICGKNLPTGYTCT